MSRGGWGAYAKKHRKRPGNKVRYNGEDWLIEYEAKTKQKCKDAEGLHYLVKPSRKYAIIKRIQHINDKPLPFYRVLSKPK